MVGRGDDDRAELLRRMVEVQDRNIRTAERWELGATDLRLKLEKDETHQGQ